MAVAFVVCVRVLNHTDCVNSLMPSAAHAFRAGFEFDVPVRFDADEIAVNLKTFLAGDIASIPIVEIFP